MAPKDTSGAFAKVTIENLDNYLLGAEDLNRPWGTWKVIKHPLCEDGIEITQERLESEPHLIPAEAEKEITVYPSPRGILSLQMHEGREEVWTVEKGTLTIILNGEKVTVEEGESIFIPRGAIHCMINETKENVVVHEIQRGMCRETDNHRLEDAHGRKDDVSDEVHATTMMKTLTDRHDESDCNTDDVLMAIFMNEVPSTRNAKLIEALQQSRDLYQPFVQLVHDYKNDSTKCVVK